MRVIIATELRFLQLGDAFYTETVGAYALWSSYLKVFSAVTVVARVRPVAELPERAQRVDGPSVDVARLRDFRGPGEGLKRLPSLLANARRMAGHDAAYILLVPGTVGTALYGWLRLRGWPYAVQVGGDPWASLSPQALRTKWAYWVRPIGRFWLHQQCWSATCANYVTREYLQRLYPTRTQFSFHCSDVWLPDEVFEWTRPQTERHLAGGYASTEGSRLIFVGSLAQRYKGLHVLLDAMQLCRRQGVALTLDVLGDGEYRHDYERQARDLGLAESVHFLGQAPAGRPVFDRLLAADLFVMPSLTEGLPKAMMEAMACGLPCIGSSVGGIPELLAAEDMVPADDAEALAQKLATVTADPERMQRMASRNRMVAYQYRYSNMVAERHAFWRKLAEVTQQHSTQPTHNS